MAHHSDHTSRENKLYLTGVRVFPRSEAIGGLWPACCVNKIQQQVPDAVSRGKLIIPTLVHVWMWHLRRNKQAMLTAKRRVPSCYFASRPPLHQASS